MPEFLVLALNRTRCRQPESRDAAAVLRQASNTHRSSSCSKVPPSITNLHNKPGLPLPRDHSPAERSVTLRTRQATRPSKKTDSTFTPMALRETTNTRRRPRRDPSPPSKRWRAFTQGNGGRGVPATLFLSAPKDQIRLINARSDGPSAQGVVILISAGGSDVQDRALITPLPCGRGGHPPEHAIAGANESWNSQARGAGGEPGPQIRGVRSSLVGFTKAMASTVARRGPSMGKPWGLTTPLESLASDPHCVGR